MKHLKILGLMAVAAAALMAFAATASATTLTSPTGTTYTSTIKAESEGTTSLDGAFVTVSCAKSIVEGKVEQHGTNTTAGGKINTLDFTECNFPVKVLEAGSLEIHSVEEITTKNIVEGKEVITHDIQACAAGKVECTGTLTSSGAKVEIETSLGICTFTTSSTDIGTLTPTNDTGKTATLDIGGPEGKTGRIPRTGGSFLCGSSGQWTGSYSVVTPDSLYVDS